MTFPLPGANWSYLHSPRLVATTGVNGFMLQNATPNILSWTAPNDGNMHRLIVFATLHVTSSETGGKVVLNFTAPDGGTGSNSMTAGGTAAGVFATDVPFCVCAEAGTTATLAQATALTAGAAVVWAEIWAW